MKVIAVIPARWASKRFPGKVLADINGKSMIRRVYEQINKSDIPEQVIVATDDERIREHVEQFGGRVVITGPHHRNGTERCNEAAKKIHEEMPVDLVINVQGDEPFLDPAMITQLVSCFHDAKTNIATLIKKIQTSDDLYDPSVVKVVTDQSGKALYFSRAAVPWLRNIDQKEWLQKHCFYKHIGIYAYRSSVLNMISTLKATPLELSESLEQLRWLENGFPVMTKITEYESIGIDTPDDLLKVSKDS